MYNWRPKLAEVDSDNPNMWARCDRCGFVTNSSKMVWQWDFRGTLQPINTRILTCGRPSCLDVPQPQNSPIILSPDPEPVFNARPFPYFLDESSWLVTEDGAIITTQTGDYIGTQLPSPDYTTGNTTRLFCTMAAPSATITVAYLDLFDGDPTTTGRSVLSAITGSSTRTDVATALSLYRSGSLYVNPDWITISAASENQTNISYAGLYSAAISGALLYSGPVSTSQTIAKDNPIVFAPLGLTLTRT